MLMMLVTKTMLRKDFCDSNYYLFPCSPTTGTANHGITAVVYPCFFGFYHDPLMLMVSICVYHCVSVYGLLQCIWTAIISFWAQSASD